METFIGAEGSPGFYAERKVIMFASIIIYSLILLYWTFFPPIIYFNGSLKRCAVTLEVVVGGWMFMESFPPISQSRAGEVGRTFNCVDAELEGQVKRDQSR